MRWKFWLENRPLSPQTIQYWKQSTFRRTVYFLKIVHFPSKDLNSVGTLTQDRPLSTDLSLSGPSTFAIVHFPPTHFGSITSVIEIFVCVIVRVHDFKIFSVRIRPFLIITKQFEHKKLHKNIEQNRTRTLFWPQNTEQNRTWKKFRP